MHRHTTPIAGPSGNWGQWSEWLVALSRHRASTSHTPYPRAHAHAHARFIRKFLDTGLWLAGLACKGFVACKKSACGDSFSYIGHGSYLLIGIYMLGLVGRKGWVRSFRAF